MAKAKPKTKDSRPKTKDSRLKTIDWNDIERRVRLLSPAGDEGVRLRASPEEILTEAQRLAHYYRRAGKPLPDILAALV